MQFFGAIVVSILLVIFVIAYYFARIALYPHTYSYEEVYKAKLELGEFDPEEWEGWEKEEVSISSPYGYQMYGYWLPVENSRGTVILVHGITVNLFASIKYVKPFRNRGFNILMYDHRNHGKSGGKFTTFGYYEKHDLKAVIDWVEGRVGQGKIIGTHGESMGAATALQHAVIDSRLAFVVEDCGYADLCKLFRFRVRQDYHIPGLILLPLGSLFSKLMAGCFFSDIKPVQNIGAVETSIFFIHGEKDAYIPPWHAEALYEAKQKGFRKIWLAPDAGHAESWLKNPAVYDEKIGEFINEVIHE